MIAIVIELDPDTAIVVLAVTVSSYDAPLPDATVVPSSVMVIVLVLYPATVMTSPSITSAEPEVYVVPLYTNHPFVSLPPVIVTVL